MSNVAKLLKSYISESIDSHLNENRRIEPESIAEYVLVGVQYSDPQYIDGVLFYDTTLRTLAKFVKSRKKRSKRR
jgi:hypothetical protein